MNPEVAGKAAARVMYYRAIIERGGALLPLDQVVVVRRDADHISHDSFGGNEVRCVANGRARACLHKVWPGVAVVTYQLGVQHFIIVNPVAILNS